MACSTAVVRALSDGCFTLTGPLGTGCGYQTAVLSRLAAHVCSIERIDALAQRADEALTLTGCHNVDVRVGDGFAGWPEHGSFEAIIVTAAPETAPDALIRQLSTDGRMVVPLGPAGGPQMLHRLMRHGDGRIVDQGLLPVAFVPMVGDSQA